MISQLVLFLLIQSIRQLLESNFGVENTRVGQVTNYDKLTLEVWTDGSIRPEEAVSLGAKILTEHLLLVVGLTDEAKDAEIMVEKKEKIRKKKFWR